MGNDSCNVDIKKVNSGYELCCSAAVLLVAFNRPDFTKQIIDILRQANIERIYVSVDGPRTGNQDDILSRDAVLREVRKIDWTQNVYIRDLPSNLGSYDHVPSSVDWFFKEEREGIVLEDDCLPSMSFFKFCNIALDAYRERAKIMWINGYNGGFNGSKGNAPYLHSRYAISWGWATWGSAWDRVRDEIALGSEPVPVLRRSVTIEGMHRTITRIFWKQNILYAMNVPNWDLRALYAIWQCGGLAVSPPLNLVHNAGFGIQAVHGGDSDDPRGIVPAFDIDLSDNPTWCISTTPLPSEDLDAYVERVVYKISLFTVAKLWIATKFPLIRRIYRKVRGKRRI